MNPLLHALNIGTLANWLGVTVFGVVALVVPERHVVPPSGSEEVSLMISEDFSLGEVGPSAAEPDEEMDSSEPLATDQEVLPAPPELPEIADFSPLPEIPLLPAPAASTRSAIPQTQTSPRPTPQKPAGKPSISGRTPKTGSPGSGSSATASGMSDAARLAAGRMPAPSYPAAARRSGQTGTVMVEFTVDAGGRVVSAYAKHPSPWPLLNDEALRTVRRWRFPAGGAMKLQRPIIFQLR